MPPRRARRKNAVRELNRVVRDKSPFLVETLDGRARIPRRYREILDNILQDIGGDVTTAQEQLARRLASMVVWSELQECELVENAAGVDIERFARIANSQRRIFETLGIERKMHNVTPSPSAYCEAKGLAL